jgi:hypothetical protein
VVAQQAESMIAIHEQPELEADPGLRPDLADAYDRLESIFWPRPSGRSFRWRRP